MTSTPLAPARPSAGRVLSGAPLLLLAAGLVVLGVVLPGDRQLPLVVVGAAAVAASTVALVVLQRGRNSGGYAVAALVWGVGTATAGLFPTHRLGPLPLSHLAFAVAELGVLVVLLRLLARARAGSDDPPLVVDALMLGSALITVGWDAFARTGHSGTTGQDAAAVTVLAVGALVAGSAVALAVEQPRLRLPAGALTLHGVGTALAAVWFHDHPLPATLAAVVAVAGAAAGLLTLPRDGVVRHGGAAAERAARRMEIASLTPGPVLLVDIVLLVVSPRADPVLFATFISLLVTFTVRHLATARSIDRATGHLTFQALHDGLTGLGNRALLEKTLTEPDHVQSLVLLEIVGLDDVSDVLGVSAGDAVVRAAAAGVRGVVEELGGQAFRTGGEQIAVVLRGESAPCVRHAERLVAAITSAPRAVEGAGRFPLTAVAGIATSAPGDVPDAAHGVMTPFVRADIALRDARHLGGGSVSVYSGAVAAEHARRTLLRERLADAVRDGGVDVHYQPLVSFTTGRVEKFEALARWEDPVLGRISPVEFIALAEESNLVVALGEHVLRHAVREAHEAGVFSAGVGLAVNVSVVQLQAPGFADVVREILVQHRIAPQLLTLELTESVFVDEDSPAERVVTELAGLGCRIAIDDFGTGYSAFGYLGRLPVHVLKVDRSLTRSLTEDVNGQSVVTCVVDLANRLGLTVVVEGVETEQQAAICRFISAPLGQGWLYSAAVPREQLGEQLSRRYPVPEALTAGERARS